jgi:uncharacterized protein YfdQ (DUF2303 family)
MSDLTKDAIQTLVKLGEERDASKAAVASFSSAQLHYLVTRNDFSVRDTTAEHYKNQPNPRRKVGDVKLLALDSLIDFITRHTEGDRTVVFADTATRKLTAILNYHSPSTKDEPAEEKDKEQEQPAEDPTEGDPSPKDLMEALMKGVNEAKAQIDGAIQSAYKGPQWADFRASYAFPLSRQWKIWTGVNGVMQTQTGLAVFIEDNIRDIADPAAVAIPDSMQLMISRLGLHLGSPTRLLETARGFEVRSEEKVRTAVNTTTGETAVVYEQKHEHSDTISTQQLLVPTAFLLTIPVFENEAPYLLLVRLRYRKQDQLIKWAFSIQGTEASLEDAFTEGCMRVIEKTSAELFCGEPPAITAP